MLLSFSLISGEEAKPVETQTVPAGTAAAREVYTDPVGGFSLSLPTGYRKLTEDETREVFKGLSESLNKNVSESVRKQPPVWFIGPVDPKLPAMRPPSLAIAFTENAEQIDPAQVSAYKDALEEKRKQDGGKGGELALSVVKVDGIPSLQEEAEMTNSLNNERDRLIRVAIPGKGKWFELVFNYSADQNEPVRAALKEALDSFKVMEHPPENVENTKKWLRVFYYTMGFGLVGILLSFVLRKMGK